MKNSTAIFFLIVISAHVFAKLLIIALFTFNQSYIIDRYCENKNKPALHCDGKCFLKKQLSREAQKDAAKSQLLQEIIEIPVFVSLDNTLQPLLLKVKGTSFMFAPFSNQYSFTFSAPAFHPPAA